jgi:hypothetical protein
MPSAFDLIDSGGGSGSGAQTDVSFLLFSCHRMALRRSRLKKVTYEEKKRRIRLKKKEKFFFAHSCIVKTYIYV